MGRPAGSKNKIEATALAPKERYFDPKPEDIRKAGASVFAAQIMCELLPEVLVTLKASLDARIALFDSGRVLIDLCYPGRLQILARHHKQLFELDESDIEGLKMEDFPAEILGKGFKTAALIDVLALPGTKKL